MTIDLSRFLARFVAEAREHLLEISDGLLLLALNPEDRETRHALFRCAHTIGGAAGMLKLKPLAEMAHRLEDALSALMEGRIPYSETLADLLRRGAEALSRQVDGTEAGREVEPDPALWEALARVVAGDEGADGSRVAEGAPAPSGGGRNDKPGTGSDPVG